MNLQKTKIINWKGYFLISPHEVARRRNQDQCGEKIKKKVKEMRWFLKFRKKSSFSVQFSIGDRVFIFKKINSSIVSEIYDVPIHGEVCNFPTKFSNMVIIDKGIWCCNKGTLTLTKFLV